MADQSTTDTPITPVKVSKTIDLSTLNLAPGTYSLKARLNTPGRVSSVSTTGINYTVTASYTVTNACSSYASHFTIKVNDTTLATGASAKVVPGDVVTVTSISSPSADLYINGLGIHEDITTLTYSEDITFTTVKENRAMTANFTINFQTIKPDYTVSGVWLMNETLTLPTAFEGKVIRAIFVASPDATDSDDEYWDGWNGRSAELGFAFFSSSRPMHYPGLGYIWNEDDSYVYLGDVYVDSSATGPVQYKGWGQHEGYRKIAFLGDQTLSATGYNWFIANATKQ